MTSAGTQDDDVSNDAGQTSDGNSTDESWTDIRRRTCRAQPPLRRWWAAALHCSSSQRCSDGRERCSSQRCCNVGRQRIAACNEFSALLQQRAGRRNIVVMASNALDLAALLRWPTARWTSQRVAAMSGSALGLGALLRCPTARWTSQRVATMSGNALGLRALLRCPTALQLRPTLRCNVFVFVFVLKKFYPTT